MASGSQGTGGKHYKYAAEINKTGGKHFECAAEIKKTGGNRFEYETVILKAGEIDGAYVVFPHDIKALFGKGRLKVHATFDGVPYDGSIVNMGVKNPDGSICYIIGIRKDIRAAIGKQAGDTVKVTVDEKVNDICKCL